MNNYSGTAKFEFYIERYRNLSSGEYYLLSKEDELVEKNIAHELTEITLYVEGSSFFEMGRRYGMADNFSPDGGGGDLDFVQDEKGNDWSDKITPEEEDRIMEKLDLKVQESCADDYEPPESAGEQFDFGDY